MNVQTIEVRHLPVTFNIDLVVGDDFDASVNVVLDGTPLPWTGVTVQTSIRTLTDTAPPSNINWTYATGAAGALTLSLSSANTTALGAATYQWWMKLVIGSKERTYFVGRLRLLPRAAAL